MDQGVACLQLGEVRHPSRIGGVEHEIGVHATDLETVGDGAVIFQIMVNPVQFFRRLSMFSHIHGEHTAACTAAERGMKEVVAKNRQVTRPGL